MDNIRCSEEEVPFSVQVVLSKIESAQLNRTKQEIAEKLQVILNKINRVFLSARLGTAIEHEEELDEDEVKPSDRQNRKKCVQMLRTFVQSRTDNKNNLSVILECLNDVGQELQNIQDDKRFQLAELEEWVVEIEDNIQMFLCDMTSCLVRLKELGALLFQLDSKPTKKKKEEITKDGVWRWWRESKVNGKILWKLQAFRPPSAKNILLEISLGTKTATELSFMLADMAESLSCNRAMGMAFTYAQSGLQNLNGAFQEQSSHVQHLQTLLDQLKLDWQAEVNRTKAELEDCKKKVAKLEGENRRLREEKDTCQLLVHQLTEDNRSLSEQQTALRAPSGKRPVLAHSAMVESKSNLLEGFHSYVLNIIETYLSKIPRHKENDIPEELQDKGLNADVASEPGILYTILLNIINDSFKNLDVSLYSHDPEIILEMATSDIEVDQGKFPENATKTSVNIPTEIRNTFPTHKLDISKMDLDEQIPVDHNLARNKKFPEHKWDTAEARVVDKEAHDEDEIGDSLTVMEQLSDTNRRKQDPTELLVHHNVQQMCSQTKTKQTELTEDQSGYSFQERLSCTSSPTSDRVNEEGPDETCQKSTKPPQTKRSVTRCVKLDDSTQKQKGTLKTLLQSENVKHFENEMEREGDNISRTLLEGVRYQMDHETKRTNLLLLQNAMQNGKISVQLYKLCKELMGNAHNVKLKCLVFLLRKYMAFRALWQVRHQLNLKLCSAREQRNGLAVKEYYIILTKLERYEGLVLGRWRTRQTEEERRYRTSLGRIIYMFNRLREEYCLDLLNPCPCKSYLLGHHFLAFEPREIQRPVIHPRWCHSMKSPNYLMKPKKNISLLPGTREVARTENPTLWKCPGNGVEVATGPSRTCAGPTIPHLLERSIHYNSSALKALQDSTGGVTEERRDP
ncbi:uncharacterized protein LOC143511638 [Brachyhypopomus gauderio]|uniref:uncharacterized protein LOC143511638 n=1 Tax=Brachyhypopomus gauderio TaxID=698409 RepID=UPI004041AFB1